MQMLITVLGGIFFLIFLYKFVQSFMGYRNKNFNKNPKNNTPPAQEDMLDFIKKEVQITACDVQNYKEEHKRQLEEKYAYDKEMERRLSDFARNHHLDSALRDLFKKIKYGNHEANKLNLTNYSRQELSKQDDKITKIFFEWNNKKYMTEYSESRSFTPDCNMGFNAQIRHNSHASS